MSAPPVILLDQVVKRYGEVTAVDRVNLTIERGEIVALLGPNGAGKTTCLDMALGLTTPDSGRAQLFGATPQEAINNRMVGVMLQSDALLQDVRVGKIIDLIAGLNDARPRLASIIERTHLAGLLKKKVRQCSGGEIQRVRLAIALIPEPQLLILDEPTAGVDPVARRSFWESMQAEAQAGRTIVFATHYLEEASLYAPRTVVMSAGRVVADKPTDQVRATVSVQHLRAIVHPDNWYDVEAALRPLLDRECTIDYHGGQLKISGPHLRQAAIALLGDERASSVELTNSSLDEAFTFLTAPGQPAPDSPGNAAGGTVGRAMDSTSEAEGK